MSFDFPANVTREIENYAEAEHISPAEAAVKLVQDALAAKRRKAKKRELTEAEWEQLRNSPTVQFFGQLSDHTLAQMEQASKEIHAERFKPRGSFTE